MPVQAVASETFTNERVGLVQAQSRCQSEATGMFEGSSRRFYAPTINWQSSYYYSLNRHLVPIPIPIHPACSHHTICPRHNLNPNSIHPSVVSLQLLHTRAFVLRKSVLSCPPLPFPLLLISFRARLLSTPITPGTHRLISLIRC